MTTTIRVDPAIDRAAFAGLWLEAWGSPLEDSLDLDRVLSRSLVHLGAFDGDRLVGHVNVAWDGGKHAFLLDPMVRPASRGQGLGTRLVVEAVRLARDRGAACIHVDYEPRLEGFYAAAGFQPTAAGLIRLWP